MKVEYKRDLNHSYLILHSVKAVDTASYQIRMLMGNVIPRLLKCRLQGVDGKIMFYYEITSRQPLASLFEDKKINIEGLQLILGGFVQVMEEMAEFLLNPENLILSPEYIYIDIEKKELYFCYLPGYEKEVRMQFQALTEYILPKLEHGDNQAVILGYGIYRRALEDSFHLELIKEELYRSGQNNDIKAGPGPEKNVLEDEIISGHMEKECQMNDFWREEEEKKGEDSQKKFGWIKKIMVCVVVVLLLLTVAGGRAFGYLPWLTAELMLGSGMVLLGVGYLILYLGERRKRKAQERGLQYKDDKRDSIPTNQKADLSEAEKMEMLLKKQEMEEERQEQALPKEFGETVVLAANIERGPASLVSREPGELATIYLSDGITVVGKLETAADAVISLPTVSRLHAKIRKKGDEYFLSDLNSRNGTSVNGRMLKNEEEYCLQDEDEVDFAQARYIFLK